MSEQTWDKFVKWSHAMATDAQNGFVTEWHDATLVTTEVLLTKYPPAKNPLVRNALLVRAKRDMSGVHCVSWAKW